MQNVYRNELKYMINKQQQHIISKRLDILCNKDQNADENGGYKISSLYFDDYIDSAVADKLLGVIKRKKMRIRIYNNSETKIKLERKVKNVDVCQKSSVDISLEEYNKIINGDIAFLKDDNNSVKNDMYLLCTTRNFKPKVIVEYMRKAYVYKYGDVRITFDDRLRASKLNHDLFADTVYIEILPKEHTILEIKYTGYLPEVIRNIIQHGSGNMQAISKYSYCRMII